jgi:Cof subfamily protein (haloacid dehalogenase superfamily)
VIERIRAVVADIDGTISLKGSRPMPRTIEAMEALHGRGILFGTASGRPLDRRTLDKARDWGLSFDFDLAMGMNGGDVWDRFHDGVEHVMPLGREHVREACELVWPFDCNVIVYRDAYDHVLARRIDDRLASNMARNHFDVEVAGLDELAAEDTGKVEIQCAAAVEGDILRAIAAHPSPDWSVVRTFAGTIEFMRPGLDKGAGLARLSERVSIPLSEILTIGDMDNDIPLVAAAGWGVAMANGSEGVKAAADAVTDYGVLEDGFGRYFFDHVL